MSLYAEGTSDSILSCQIFVKRTNDFPKRSAWEDEKKPRKFEGFRKLGFHKKERKSFF